MSATDSADSIEIGEDIDVSVVLDVDNEVLGTVVDDLIVATGVEGSLVDETIDILDADGNLVVEDEIIDVYDADGQLIAETEVVTAIE
ncbi:MAG: hypothetical protein Q7L55_07420 [Actinomycetota bacterium]|nr:hypothetical protein [Actinomycetota bacterium]